MSTCEKQQQTVINLLALIASILGASAADVSGCIIK